MFALWHHCLFTISFDHVYILKMKLSLINVYITWLKMTTYMVILDNFLIFKHDYRVFFHYYTELGVCTWGCFIYKQMTTSRIGEKWYTGKRNKIKYFNSQACNVEAGIFTLPTNLKNQRLDERLFWAKLPAQSKSRTKMFSSHRPKGGRSSTPLSSSLPFPPFCSPSALSAPAMVALASLSSLCPCGLARRRAASASISCCAVATPSSGKGTHGCPLPFLSLLLVANGVAGLTMDSFRNFVPHSRITVSSLLCWFRSQIDPSMCDSEACWKRGRRPLNF